MGYAGNMEPSYLIPTAIAESLNKVITIYSFSMEYSLKHKVALLKSLKILN